MLLTSSFAEKSFLLVEFTCLVSRNVESCWGSVGWKIRFATQQVDYRTNSSMRGWVSGSGVVEFPEVVTPTYWD